MSDPSDADRMHASLGQGLHPLSPGTPRFKRIRIFKDALQSRSAESDAEIVFFRSCMVEMAAAKARRRLARDIHDHAGQYLVAARFQLAALEQRATDGYMRSSLADLRMILDRFGEELRAVSAGQSIEVPRGSQLTSALSHLVGQWQHDVGIPVSFVLDVPETFEPDDAVAKAVFRVAQEGLTNVAKHAPDASAVHVSLRLAQFDLRLTIEDDGPGLPERPETVACHSLKGTGIDGMRDRLKELGGRLIVHSTVGAGTQLLSIIPLDAEAACGGGPVS